jgi:hypothetical protein
MNPRIIELMEIASAGACHDVETNTLIGTEIERFAALLLEDMRRNVIASILITDVVKTEQGIVATSEDYIAGINKDFGVE